VQTNNDSFSLGRGQFAQGIGQFVGKHFTRHVWFLYSFWFG
jgi:hypothetical protein